MDLHADVKVEAADAPNNTSARRLLLTVRRNGGDHLWRRNPPM